MDPRSSPAYDLYLNHLKLCLTGALHDQYVPIARPHGLQRFVYDALRRRGLQVVRHSRVDTAALEDGPSVADGLTMIGFKRLDNLRECVETILVERVPGDLIETGVWRGGACIFLRAVLEANGADRDVWAADSFAGMPRPDPDRFPADAGLEDWADAEGLAVSLDQVRENFRRYGYLDDRVHFLEGWFRDTLPTLRDRSWALIRLDGDFYESTMDALENLYPGLSSGGFAVIDDYRAWETCRKAVDDYRSKNGVTEPIVGIDSTAVYWRKS
jgi:O-methyltransferase